MALTLISNSFELVLCARYFLRIRNSFNTVTIIAYFNGFFFTLKKGYTPETILTLCDSFFNYQHNLYPFINLPVKTTCTGCKQIMISSVFLFAKVHFATLHFYF